MMTNSIYGMTNYYNLFTSPFKSYELNPVSNLAYSAGVSKAYMNSFAKSYNSEMSSYLSSLNSGISDLKASSKPFMTDGLDSSFDKKAVLSSDNSSASGTAFPNASREEYTINVSKLASSQVNSGSILRSNAQSSINNGLNIFSVQLGSNKEKLFAVDISSSDTNKSALDKMAKSINGARMGITASVVTDYKDNSSYIKLSSSKSGLQSTFSISDISGNAVAASGADRLSAAAQDAEYTVNGKHHTSSDNIIDLDNNKVSVSLHKADGKDIKLTVDTDTKSIKSDITHFAKNYNALVSTADYYSSQSSGASKLASELDDLSGTHRLSLSLMGIKVNADGSLSVDDKALDRAIAKNPNGLRDVMGSFAEDAYTKGNSILNSPMSYYNPADFAKTLGGVYGGAQGMPSMYGSRSIYSGLLVDALL